ncbi:unnamed protein product, partial [Meganyctiphanes norvegica]
CSSTTISLWCGFLCQLSSSTTSTTPSMWQPQRLHFLLLIAMIGLAQCNTQVEKGNCPFLFTDVAGTCYFFSSTVGATAPWYDALAACQTFGLEYGLPIGLAEVGTRYGCASPDVDLMEEVSRKGVDAWLGANDIQFEGTWIWENSKYQLYLSNNMWYPDYPSGGTSRNCLAASIFEMYHRRAYFMDYPCNNLHDYVC